MNSEIPVQEIIWDEVALFEKEHKGHGGFNIFFENSPDEELMEITLGCSGNYLKNIDDCPQCNRYTIPELTYSIIYQNEWYYAEPSNELKIQTRERIKKLGK